MSRLTKAYLHKLPFCDDLTPQEGIVYGSYQIVRRTEASILYDMSFQEGDEGSQLHHYEEWQPGGSGRMPNMWHKYVRDRIGKD